MPIETFLKHLFNWKAKVNTVNKAGANLNKEWNKALPFCFILNLYIIQTLKYRLNDLENYLKAIYYTTTQ